ncbi:hypothetical protein REPUB_Repub15cG0063500 [Reevesia pubescens]
MQVEGYRPCVTISALAVKEIGKISKRREAQFRFSQLGTIIGVGDGIEATSKPGRLLRVVKPFNRRCYGSSRLSTYFRWPSCWNSRNDRPRSQIALPTQLSLKFKISSKFALCIPSSTPDSGLGDIFVGGGPYLSEPLTFTPLLINPVSTAPVFSEGEVSEEYFINVKSIKVEEKPVSLKTSLLSIDKNGFGGTKISTINPYTVLHTSIYKPLVQEFANKAAAMKITRVSSVAPFGLCFSSKTIGNSGTGPAVPAIDLVLESNRVPWRIYGHNSMVKVNEKVMCLGIVDGGSKPRTSIVIGGHQLDDNLVEFDLVSSKLGFSSSLLLKNTSCSHFRAL